MPGNPKRRKRSEEDAKPAKGVKLAKLAHGKPHRTTEPESEDLEDFNINDDIESGASDSNDERLDGVGEDGIDLSELMDMDDTPVTEPNSNHPTSDHMAMLRNIQSGLRVDDRSQKERRREELKMAGPAKKENAFGVSAEGSAKIDLSELMEVAGLDKTSKKNLAKLSHSERRVGAQLSKEAKARLERSVQYESTKALLQEWAPTVQALNTAEQLVFPLKDPQEKQPKKSTSDSFSSFKPTSDLELMVSGILEESGITESKLQHAEELAAKKLSKQELMARAKEMARLRRMMYYEERKHAQQKKIKSRKYRKILRKQKEKDAVTLAELQELDPEAYEAELEKLERARAAERVSLKHSNVTKWAKHALRSKSPNLVQSAREHLNAGRKLRERMQSENADEEDSDDFSDVSSIRSSDLESDKEEDEDDGVGEEGDIIDIHGNIVRPVKKNKKADDAEQTEGVFAMDFMKRAAAKKRMDQDALYEQMDAELATERRKLREQRQRAKEAYLGEIPADSDSDAETAPATSSIATNGASKHAPSALTASKSGRRSVAASSAQTAASALLRSRTHMDDDKDEQSGEEDFMASMEVDRTKGFTSTVSSGITVKDKVVQQPVQEDSDEEADVPSANEEEWSDSNEDGDGAIAFKPNSKNIKELIEASRPKAEKPLSKQEQRALEQKAKEEAKKAKKEAKKAKKEAIDEDRVFISASLAKKTPSSNPFESESDEDEAVIDISRPSKAPAPKESAQDDEENPWMMVDSDDDGLVIPGTHDPNSASSTTTSSKKKQKKKLSEDKVAVDLEKVAKQLKEQEAKHDAVFNLAAAGATSQSQRELIERAFAADHLTSTDLEVDKKAQVEAANEVEKEYKTLLMPGWGEWAGTGTKPSRKRVRLVEEMEKKKDAKSKELMKSRKDNKLRHVIMTEKSHPASDLYHAGNVPHQYEGSAELYEATLRMPLGREWNASAGFRDLSKPKVLVKGGLVIEPIQKKIEGVRRKNEPTSTQKDEVY